MVPDEPKFAPLEPTAPEMPVEANTDGTVTFGLGYVPVTSSRVNSHVAEACDELRTTAADRLIGVVCQLAGFHGVPAAEETPMRTGTLALEENPIAVTVRKSDSVVALVPAPAVDPVTDSTTVPPPSRVPVNVSLSEEVSAAVEVKTMRRWVSSGMLDEFTVATDVAAVDTLPTRFDDARVVIVLVRPAIRRTRGFSEWRALASFAAGIFSPCGTCRARCRPPGCLIAAWIQW